MIYQFGLFSLDIARRELREGESLVAVEPQVFDVLKFLIEARDRVVSRDALLEAVWQGRIVSEATLSSRINAARVAIGDTGAAQRLIRTLPRKGFRFVAPVHIIEGEDEAALKSAPASFAGRRPSRLPALAVLPFTNLSGDPAQTYFGEGMAEEIITALSRNSGLFVIARNSSFIYQAGAADVRRIGQELGVGYVLEGSVRRGAGQLRITGQLVDAASGAYLWSERFDGDLQDVFDLQERVAASVAAVIEPTLQRAEIGRLLQEPPTHPDAYDHVLRAYAQLGEFTAASMTSALDHLQQALALDPHYAHALAAAAYTRAQCHFQGWAYQTEVDRREAVSAAWRAIEIAPEDAQVLWMAAFALWNMAGTERERARTVFRRSLLINPNSAMALTLTGWIETMCGNVREGRAMVLRSQALNPRDPHGWLTAGVLALAAIVDEDYPEAARLAEQALAQNARFAVALRVLAVALVRLGEVKRARGVTEELLHIEPDLTVSTFFARIPIPLASMAKIYAEALRIAGLPA